MSPTGEETTAAELLLESLTENIVGQIAKSSRIRKALFRALEESIQECATDAAGDHSHDDYCSREDVRDILGDSDYCDSDGVRSVIEDYLSSCDYATLEYVTEKVNELVEEIIDEKVPEMINEALAKLITKRIDEHLSTMTFSLTPILPAIAKAA